MRGGLVQNEERDERSVDKRPKQTLRAAVRKNDELQFLCQPAKHPKGVRLWFLASEAGTTEPMPYGLAQRIAEE
jgi:hypothetical protein